MQILLQFQLPLEELKKVRFKDIGYDYPSDKTLRPEAIVPPIVKIDNLDTITGFDVINSGKRYLTDPDLIVWNETTNEIVDTTSLIGHAPNGSISEIEQLFLYLDLILNHIELFQLIILTVLVLFR